MTLNLKFKWMVLPAILLAGGIVACDDNDENGNGNGNGNADMGTTDMGGPMMNLQEQAVANGQVQFTDATGNLTIDPDTLAVDVSGAGLTTPTEPLPAGFEQADYYGAVDPMAATPFWEGWTYIDPAADGSLPGDFFHPLQAEIENGDITPAAMNACTTVNSDFQDGGTVDVFGATFPVCVIPQGNYVDDVSLPNNHVFVINGTVTFGTGDEELMGGMPSDSATLTIAAGTQVYAAADANSILVISRGSQIDAQGTAMMPIIFGGVEVDTNEANVITDSDVTNLSDRGVWGGVVLSGFGEENSGNQNGELLTEAAPTALPRWFGGFDNQDNSGTMRYAVIAETGFQFDNDEEVQGLTLEAVGSGTSLSWIQVIGSEDDCVEWFGGAADMSRLICNGVDDDGLDIDEGYQGNIQFAIVRIGANNGNHGIESDNNSTPDQMPFTTPNIANLTVLGNAGRQDETTRGALHREGFRGKVYRSVFADDTPAGGVFEDGCLDIDDQLDPPLQHFDSVFACSPAPLADDDDT